MFCVEWWKFRYTISEVGVKSPCWGTSWLLRQLSKGKSLSKKETKWASDLKKRRCELWQININSQWEPKNKKRSKLQRRRRSH